jgi:cell fate regulator YaaT (PSP1 superfamily)
MLDTIGVVFKDNGRVYYFSPNELELKKNMNVVVETERGFQFGKTITDITKTKKENLNLPLKNVIRIASKEDEKINNKNIEDAKKAFEECIRLIEKNKLDMNLIDANFTFDRNQLIFHFTADDRIDFRKLAKDLASIFKTRIELRQIGVRDKAREVGGLGPCGRPLCCSSFLKSFDTVSINMAKTQNLALNPSKINGSCGRLLCCLNYENETYQDLRKDMPDIGDKVRTKNGMGKVISLDVLKKSYKVINENNDIEIVEIDNGSDK